MIWLFKLSLLSRCRLEALWQTIILMSYVLRILIEGVDELIEKKWLACFGFTDQRTEDHFLTGCWFLLDWIRKGNIQKMLDSFLVDD